MITQQQIDEAAHRISPHILKTPLLRSRWLSDCCKGEVFLKLESEQYTGSFKARGSLNKLMWLQEQGIRKMPVTASTGNHGLGFARALDLLEMQGKIYLPEHAVSSKVEAIKTYGAAIDFYGDDPYTTEMYACKIAAENDWVYVSPYNDEQIIAGQGTIGREIINQIGHVDNLLATVGGGGLISGLASYLRKTWPQIYVVGCQPANSPEMATSVRAGEYRQVATKPTLSDGSAGGFEREAITFKLCQELVDEFLLVSEEQIKHALRQMIKHHSKLVEGAAAVALACCLENAAHFAGKTTVIVVCGANIAIEKLREVL